MNARQKFRNLLCEITSCDNVVRARNSVSHPCNKIVNYQPWSDFRVPEPWNGDLENAEILYVGKNPGIRLGKSSVPRWGNPCRELIDFFTDNETRQGFLWKQLENRTKEINDNLKWVATNVVHCKSGRSYGYREAFETCFDLYLENILSLSNADMIVALGNAKKAFKRLYSLELGKDSHIFRKIGNKERLVTWLPRHSGSVGKFNKNQDLNCFKKIF